MASDALTWENMSNIKAQNRFISRFIKERIPKHLWDKMKDTTLATFDWTDDPGEQPSTTISGKLKRDVILYSSAEHRTSPQCSHTAALSQCAVVSELQRLLCVLKRCIEIKLCCRSLLCPPQRHGSPLRSSWTSALYSCPTSFPVMHLKVFPFPFNNHLPSGVPLLNSFWIQCGNLLHRATSRWWWPPDHLPEPTGLGPGRPWGPPGTPYLWDAFWLRTYYMSQQRTLPLSGLFNHQTPNFAHVIDGIYLRAIFMNRFGLLVHYVRISRWCHWRPLMGILFNKYRNIVSDFSWCW